jgi:menaquinone-dependent protoporphyrinogen oxidase
MLILVAYASKHGATEGIAKRIARTFALAGHQVDVRPVRAVGDPAGYDAIVVGSAVYASHWRKHASQFVWRHQRVLAHRPLWLFSSGPLGTESADANGRDPRVALMPAEIEEFTRILGPRGHRVFFGALNPAQLTWAERAIRILPTGRKLLPEGDFRDWADVDAWAGGIARELTAAAA